MIPQPPSRPLSWLAFSMPSRRGNGSAGRRGNGSAGRRNGGSAYWEPLLLHHRPRFLFRRLCRPKISPVRKDIKGGLRLLGAIQGPAMNASTPTRRYADPPTRFFRGPQSRRSADPFLPRPAVTPIRRTASPMALAVGDDRSANRPRHAIQAEDRLTAQFR
jgi:hypothetical protein